MAFETDSLPPLKPFTFQGAPGEFLEHEREWRTTSGDITDIEDRLIGSGTLELSALILLGKITSKITSLGIYLMYDKIYMTPYTDIEVTDKYIIREFNENIDPIELLWHRDDESRINRNT
jgi:hypothetical protein